MCYTCKKYVFYDWQARLAMCTYTLRPKILSCRHCDGSVLCGFSATFRYKDHVSGAPVPNFFLAVS